MTSNKSLLIVTDLDASLLEEDYSYTAALPAIEALKALECPIVLNSSKTLAELKQLSLELELDSPVIGENGGHVFFPDPEPHTAIQGLARVDILKYAHELRAKKGYRFEGFTDWSVEEIAEHTGLRLSDAQLASERFITEPILWNDTSERWEVFLSEMEEIGARALLGGRFIHLMGKADKAQGLKTVQQFYCEKYPHTEWMTVALGDSPNDQQMLDAADIAVVIPHAGGRRIEATLAARTIFAKELASKGWNEAIFQILHQEKLKS